MFKDIGIETVFNKIALRDTPEDLEHPEDALVDAFNTSNLGDGHLDAAEERGKVGQIVVELKRVRLGKKYSELGHRAKHYEGDKDDVDMEEVGQEVAHKTA